MRIVQSALSVFSLLLFGATIQAQDEFPFGAQKSESRRMLKMRDGVARASQVVLTIVPNH